MGRMSQPARWTQALLLLFGMAGVIYSAFFIVKAPGPTSGFNAPEAARILFFHVPCAELCSLGFFMALVHAIGYLMTRNPRQDARSLVAARLGLLFGVLALGMGMAWAKVEWGAAWNWDPRQTGLALALVTYMAYFGLRSAIDDPEKQGALAAVYAVLACPTAMFLIFGLPRMRESLHLKPGEVSLPGAFGYTILAAMVAFASLFVWIYVLETRVTLLVWKREGRLERE
jgi:heme exporter protein C